MPFWIHVFDAFVVFGVLSTLALVCWCVVDVIRQRPPRGATRRNNRREIVVLQWRRRQALRRLGSRWVLHPNQPPVNWGYRHD